MVSATLNRPNQYLPTTMVAQRSSSLKQRSFR
jgi:hypothetical protein